MVTAMSKPFNTLPRVETAETNLTSTQPDTPAPSFNTLPRVETAET